MNQEESTRVHELEEQVEKLKLENVELQKQLEELHKIAILLVTEAPRTEAYIRGLSKGEA